MTARATPRARPAPKQVRLFAAERSVVTPRLPRPAPIRAGERSQVWRTLHVQRTRAMQLLKEGPFTLDMALETLRVARIQERLAWATMAPDLTGADVPTRLNDERIGRPVGLVLADGDSIEEVWREGSTRGEKRRRYGSVTILPGGGYQVELSAIRLSGSTLGPLLEQAREVYEASGEAVTRRAVS